MAINHPEWLNRNSLRAFPLAEDSQRISDRGWSLPDALLVDALVLAGSCPAGIYLSAVGLTRSLLTIIFSCASSGEALGAAMIRLGRGSHYESIALSPIQSGVAGCVTVGSGADMLGEIPSDLYGTHRFEPANRLESRCVIETGPFPVTSIAANLSDEPPASGEATLSVGPRLLLDRGSVYLSGDLVTQLILSLADPEAFLPPCASPASPLSCTPKVIYSINEVTPDEAGEVEIEFRGFSSVLPLEGAIKAILLTQGEELCDVAPMPDTAGRLPVDYNADLDPQTGYDTA